MKLLIVSDSHGAVSSIERALRRERPALLIHLGDGWQDARRLLSRCPDLLADPEDGADRPARGRAALVQVPGNCDLQETQPPERQLTLAGCRLLLCHGHTYGVKGGLHRARAVARQSGLHGFFFGHTHRPLVQQEGETLFLNPGSIGPGPRPTYAVAEAAEGVLEARTVYLDP